MARTIDNLNKSQEGWDRLSQKAKNRAFANRTDASKRTGIVRLSFQASRVAAIAMQGEDEN